MTSPIYGSAGQCALRSSTGVGMVVGLYQPWRTMTGNSWSSDQTCPLQSLQKTKKSPRAFLWHLSPAVREEAGGRGRRLHFLPLLDFRLGTGIFELLFDV